MTDETETPKTSDTVIASAQADTTPGALSDASMTDKPGNGGALFDADGNPIAPVEVPEPAPSNEVDDLVYRTPEQREAFAELDANVTGNQAAAEEPAPDGDLRSDVEALKADLLYLRSLHGWPVEEGSKLKAYYHDGLKKLGIGG